MLTWNPLANYSTPGAEIRGFKLFYYIKGTDIQNESVKKLSPTPLKTETKLKNLELNSTYYISMLAYNDLGDGPRSEYIDFNTPSGIWSFLSPVARILQGGGGISATGART